MKSRVSAEQSGVRFLAGHAQRIDVVVAGGRPVPQSWRGRCLFCSPPYPACVATKARKRKRGRDARKLNVLYRMNGA